jgi:DNA-binding MarR family transcriptional regulator
MNRKQVNKIRAFNRFYTSVIGLLDKYLLDSQYTLPEVRVMFEIYHHGKISSKEITALLQMDKGYLSRILLLFEQKGLIKRSANEEDGRQQEISLTSKGEKEFLVLDQASEKQIAGLLGGLSKNEIEQLTTHMDAIQKIFSKNNHQHGTAK